MCPGKFKRNFNIAGECNFTNFADNSKSCRPRILMKILEGWNSHQQKNIPSWSMIRITGRIQEFLNGIYTLLPDTAVIKI